MKKGFTLVELLAVIIILGAIMLIVVPTVITSINGSNERSFQLSASKILESAEIHFANTGITNELNYGFYEVVPISDLGIKNSSKYDSRSSVVIANIGAVTDEFILLVYLANDDYMINGVVEEKFDTYFIDYNATDFVDIDATSSILINKTDRISGNAAGATVPDATFVTYNRMP